MREKPDNCTYKTLLLHKRYFEENEGQATDWETKSVNHRSDIGLVSATLKVQVSSTVRNKYPIFKTGKRCEQTLKPFVSQKEDTQMANGHVRRG